MLKLGISLFIFITLLSGGLYFSKNFTPIQNLSRCYEMANSIFRQTNLISRRTYTSDEKICQHHKTIILDAAHCFAKQKDLAISPLERTLQHRFAQLLSRETQTLESVIERHNNSCLEATVLPS